MNKRKLYESIMKNVAIQVKKALNESIKDPDVNFVIYDNYNDRQTTEDYDIDAFNEWFEQIEKNESFANYCRSYFFENYFVEDDDEWWKDLSDQEIIDEMKDNGYYDEYQNKWKDYMVESFIEYSDDLDWNDAEEELNGISGNFVAFGSKESWHESNTGIDTFKNTSLLNVINSEATDCDYLIIEKLINGGVRFTGIHHDGSVNLDIHLLTVDPDEFDENIQELKNSKYWKNIDIE